MYVDGYIYDGTIDRIGAIAREHEDLDYDGLFLGEAAHDPFLPLASAVGTTTRLTLGTGIALAFPRSPMHLANLGHDLQVASGGRFVLGLGAQVRIHIERRFSTPWSRPADRMRELVEAVRAVWRCWNDGEKLAFRGDFYTLTLMTPFFMPAPSPTGPPPIFVAAVGERMTETAGEVGDGVFVHPFTTERYLRERTWPALERGLGRGGRDRSALSVCLPVFVIVGEDDADIDAQVERVREHIAFYASTPAYRPVLELHGWQELQDELNALTKQGRWKEMGTLVTDEILDAFAVRGSAAGVASEIVQRFGCLVDRISFYTPGMVTPARWSSIVASIRDQTGAATQRSS